MNPPRTYRITGLLNQNHFSAEIMAMDSTKAHYLAYELFPSVKIKSIYLAEEWS